MRRERQVRLHDQRVGGKVEEVGGMRVLGHGMANRGDDRPATGLSEQRVCIVGGIREERRVS